MSDDLKKTGNPDRKNINVHEAYEVRDWSKKFGVTEEQLKSAVKTAGVYADDVKKHLGK